jgi:hypothetical protein
MRKFRRTAGPVICIVLVVMVMYFASYAYFGRRGYFLDRQTNAKYAGMGFNDVWQAKLFAPAAAIESYVCGRNVATGTRTEITSRFPARQKSED